MTNLIIKKDGTEVLNEELSTFMLSGNELTATFKLEQFMNVSLVQNQMYYVTIENSNGNGIVEKPAIYRSYLFSVTDTKIQQQDSVGNIVEVPTNVISANQLLFQYIY